MTREEAIKILNDEEIASLVGKFHGGKEALDLALSALRPVGREQVEKARWIKIYEDGEPAIEQPQIGVACSKCMNMPKDRFTESKFCPNCGRPMTDEAVQILIERMEELKHES